jgi:hypothetical protein
MIQARAKGVPLDEAVTLRSGVTEVFFTTGGGGGGSGSVLEENAAKASAVIQLGVKSLESGLGGVLGALPPNVRGPAFKYRWAIFGVSVTFLALFLAWAFKPNEPPPSSISAAPDGVSPAH